VLRETTFVVGGGLTVALGAALVVGLALGGAGVAYFGAWLGGGLTIGMGAFCVYSGRAETRERRKDLDRVESDSGTPSVRRP